MNQILCAAYYFKFKPAVRAVYTKSICPPENWFVQFVDSKISLAAELIGWYRMHL